MTSAAIVKFRVDAKKDGCYVSLTVNEMMDAHHQWMALRKDGYKDVSITRIQENIILVG